MRSVFLAVLAAFVLIACGGGGAASSDTTTSVIDGKLKSGLIVASDADAAATGTTASTDGTGLVLSNPTGELRNLKSGQVVVLPANDSQGLPMGYTGVAPGPFTAHADLRQTARLTEADGTGRRCHG